MEAQNRLLGEWLERVRTGQLRLPRFQRYEAWSHTEVSSLLETVIRGLPAGATLILQVGDEEQFRSRTMVGAPEATGRPNEHLLDGQQRITALYRAFNDDYEDRTYFVSFENDDDTGELPIVVGQSRRTGIGGRRYPLWADDPRQVYERGLLPIRLLRPGDLFGEIVDWCDAATSDADAARELTARISRLRESLATYNIPFLVLPPTTPKDVALDVFIKLNTSSVRLTPFDIVVAQLEDARGASLHELVEELDAAVPGLRRYREINDFILDVAALRQDRSPTRASYFMLDLDGLAAGWQEMIDGLRFTVETLEAERIFDGRRLPTVAVLPVLAALHAELPATLDAAGNARVLVRGYLWRAFTTSRYEHSSATRSLQDLRGLRAEARGGTRSAPIFDGDAHPLPTPADIMRAGWPKTREVLARGILAASLRAGGEDLADGARATTGNLDQREYHHLFPDALLTGPGRLTWAESYRAVNCALITWHTNRTISAKEPLAYLRERIQQATLGQDEIIRRLATHLVPHAPLIEAGGYADLDGQDAADRIAGDYDRFCRTRADLVADYLISLAQGEEPQRLGTAAS